MGLYFSFLSFTPTPLPLSSTSDKCLTMEFSLATLASAGRIVSASSFASLAFLLYDHVLTFDTEIRLVWNYPGHRFGKGLFLFNRYFGPFTLILNISGEVASFKTVIFLIPSKSIRMAVCFAEGLRQFSLVGRGVVSPGSSFYHHLPFLICLQRSCRYTEGI
ncbi:hypothetical protein JB92DRAFT_2968621 [Gautieria morchelliformis]|nr:hypothetical protein JB92DRAFT_2968621 [Gautieria morchelliformis]